MLLLNSRTNGEAIGVGITAPSAVPLDRVNRVLADLGETPVTTDDYPPLRAASRRGRSTDLRNVQRRARLRLEHVDELLRRHPLAEASSPPAETPLIFELNALAGGLSRSFCGGRTCMGSQIWVARLRLSGLARPKAGGPNGTQLESCR